MEAEHGNPTHSGVIRRTALTPVCVGVLTLSGCVTVGPDYEEPANVAPDAWNQAIAAASHPIFLAAERFSINILAEDQVDLSRRFSRPSDDRFAGLAVTSGLGGVPLIDGCCAALECRKVATYDGGDHTIFIGRVERVNSTDQSPLLFGDGQVG